MFIRVARKRYFSQPSKSQEFQLAQLSEVLDGANHLRGVAVLVVVPGNNLHLIGVLIQLSNHGLGGIPAPPLRFASYIFSTHSSPNPCPACAKMRCAIRSQNLFWPPKRTKMYSYAYLPYAARTAGANVVVIFRTGTRSRPARRKRQGSLMHNAILSRGLRKCCFFAIIELQKADRNAARSGFPQLTADNTVCFFIHRHAYRKV